MQQQRASLKSTLASAVEQDRRLRVCYFFGQAAYGGAPAQMFSLADGLRARGHVVAIGVEAKSAVADAAAERDLPTFDVGALKRNPSWRGDRVNRSMLRSFLKEFRPDILHLHGFKAGLIGRSLGSTVPPVVYTPHCPVYLSRMSWSKRAVGYAIELGLSRRSKATIAVDEWESRHLHLPRVVLIPNAVEPNVGLHARRMGHTPRVAFVARMSEPKRQDLLLRALALLGPHERPEVTFFGDGPTLATNELLASELGLGDSVRFAGHVPDPIAAYGRPDLAVLLSDWEVRPLSALEALASGVPVLGSNIGGFKSIAAATTGIKLVENSPVAVAAALNAMLIEIRTDHLSLSSAAKSVNDVFSREAMINATESLYRDVVASDDDPSWSSR